MEIPRRLYGYGQVAVDSQGTAHRIALVVERVNEREVWSTKTQRLEKRFDKDFRYGLGCIREDADQPLKVPCYSAQWAAEIVGITDACTTCWPNEEEL